MAGREAVGSRLGGEGVVVGFEVELVGVEGNWLGDGSSKTEPGARSPGVWASDGLGFFCLERVSRVDFSRILRSRRRKGLNDMVRAWMGWEKRH